MSITLDQARERLQMRLTDLILAEHSGDTARIQRAQDEVKRAETVLREVTLRDEGGWRP